jgi:hypothetical protein
MSHNFVSRNFALCPSNFHFSNKAGAAGVARPEAQNAV